MPQLDPTWFASQLLWLLISFALLYFVLSRFILPPLTDIIARRQQSVSGDIATAQSLKTQAEQAREAYERSLAQAREQAQKLIDQAHIDEKARSEEANKALDRDIASKLNAATQQIEAKKQELMKGLTPAASDLAGLIVEKLAKRAPGRDQVESIVGDLLKGRR